MKLFFGWVYFVLVQIVALALFPFGLLVCGMLSWAAAWTYAPTTQYLPLAYRVISVWRGGRITWIFGNDEDGVTGPGWYNPLGSRWLTFKWSALRNPVNNLRFLTMWKGGPWFQRRARGWYLQAGFRPDTGWPVLSVGRGRGTVL